MGCAIGLALEYLRCRRCGHVWLDDPSCSEALLCPSCGSADVEQVTGRRGGVGEEGSKG